MAKEDLSWIAKIDTKDAEQSLKKLGKTFNQLEEEAKKVKLDDPELQGYIDELKSVISLRNRAQAKVRTNQQSYETYKSTKPKIAENALQSVRIWQEQVNSKNQAIYGLVDKIVNRYQALTTIIPGTSSRMAEAYKNTERMEQAAEKTSSAIGTTERKAEELTGSMQNVATAGESFLNIFDKDVSQMGIVELINYIRELKVAKEGLSDEQQRLFGPTFDAELTAANTKLGESYSQFISIAQKAIPLVTSALNGMANAIKSALSRLGDLAKNILSTFKSIGSTISNNITKSLGRIKKSMDKAFSSSTLKKNLNTLIKYTFGVRSLYFLFKRLRTAVIDGMKNLVQYNSATNQTNKAISELRTSLLYLKNAWAAAFAPIINVVEPYLTLLLNRLADVGNAIARFIAALTGQKTVIQAVRTDAGNYADSLKKAGSGAGSAAKKQKQLNDRLAEFDDLNVLGIDKDPSKSGSGGGGGSGNLTDLDPNKMFKTILTPMSELANMIAEAWEYGDFSKLGTALSMQFSNALKTAYEWLVGDGRELIKKIAKSIGTFIDGFLYDENLGYKIGAVLDAAITDGLIFVLNLITPERVGKIGEAIAKALTRASAVLPKIGDAIGRLILSAISGFYEFTNPANFNYEEFGKNLGEAINRFFNQMGKIDKGGQSGWQKLGASLSNGVNGLLTAINKAFETADPAEIGAAIGQFLASIDIDEGQIKILLDNLWTAITNAWDKLKKENPSLVALFLDIGDIASDIAIIVGTIVGAVSIIAGVLSTLAKFIPILISIASLLGGKAGVGVGLSIIISSASSLLALLSPFIITLTLIIAVIAGVIESIYAWNVANERGRNGLIGIKDAVFMLFSGAIPSLIYAVRYCTGVIEGNVGGLKDNIISILTTLKEKAKPILQTILNFFGKLAQGVVTVVNSIINALNSIKAKIPDEIKALGGAVGGLAGLALNFNLKTIPVPSIPKLAQGAVIPPNREFLAMLGDQKSGTNIEAPLDTIKQAVSEEMLAYITAMQEGFEEVVSAINRKELVVGDKEIGKANARFTAQQRLIRGTSI